jgi:hypothetical protein
MAQWKETLEPYVKVQERIKTAAVNPVAGEDLIIGAVLISDAGPSIPTLITSQSEFLSTYASEDLTSDYVNSINKLYKGDDNTMASTMWLNAYRLAGSANLLVVRASKAKDINFARPITKNDNNVYLLRDGQLLKKVPSFKIVVDIDKEKAEHTTDGWSISINGIGVIGNRNTDDGAQYDYFVQNLEELVEYLNDTPNFFSPSFTLYEDEKATIEASNSDDAVSVVFEEVYLGADIIDTTDSRCGDDGLCYVVTCERDWTPENPSQKIIDLNKTAYSGFEEVPYYAINNYNSSTTLKLRIRRFNHDAVITKELSTNDCNAGGNSPYTVLSSVLDTLTNNGTGIKNGKVVPSEDTLYRDFYEIAVLDPAIDSEPLYFNLGNISGRGDMEVADLNDSLKMIQVQLPDNLADLGLDYYGYLPSSKKIGWASVSAADLKEDQIKAAKAFGSKAERDSASDYTPAVGDVTIIGAKSSDLYVYKAGSWQKAEGGDDVSNVNYVESSLATLKSHVLIPSEGDVARVGEDVEGTYYLYKEGLSAKDIDPEEIYLNLSIDPEKYTILNVSDTDLVKAIDLISQDEVYVTEGLTDLGATSSMFQTALANVAISDNYFYAFSTVNSTNYLAIANSVNRLSQDSSKLYVSAPWDVDTGTVGFKFYAAPSVLFWEAVCRNRALDREFYSVFGFGSTGVAQYQKPVVEFNKKQRQLLLSKKVNTVLWDTNGQKWCMNDAYTKQSEDNILGEDGNSRLNIRISKAMPVLLRQFIGRKINDTLYADAYTVIDYWFKNTIGNKVDDYRITIADINTEEDQRANRMRVLVEVRYARSLRFIEVVNTAYDMGLEFTGTL